MPSPTEYVVSPQDIEAFQRDGAVCLRRVYDRPWLDAVAAGIERNLAAPGPGAEFLGGDTGPVGGGRFFDDYCNWRKIPEFRDYVTESPSAHPVDGRQICSIWMPVDPVPLESSLQFVKGSHAWGRWFVPRKFSSAANYQVKNAAGIELYESVPDVEGQPEQFEILSWPLEPGDCIVFHGAALHGAAGNTSLARSRRVLSTRWVGDDARLAERPWEISPPITGGLAPGDPLACDEFPVMWPRS